MRKALVIGIDNYPNAPLRGCVNDANSIANCLETHSNGAPNFEVKLVTSPSDLVSRAKLRGDIENLFAGDCDVALLYFSGHGTVTSTGGYIVTTDALKYEEGVSMDDILLLANKSRVRDKIIILDCCYSGTLGNPEIIGDGTAKLSDGLSVLTASRPNESAQEIDGKGVFTSLVVDALHGGAADLRGNVTAGSIYAYVDQALGEWGQRPIFKTNVSRFTSLRSVSPPISPETLRKICDYFPAAQDEHKLDPSYEFTNSRDNPPPTVVEPIANQTNVSKFKDLQKLAGVGLVVPVGEDHMYFAAMNSKACRLTALGYQYWRLVKNKKI